MDSNAWDDLRVATASGDVAWELVRRDDGWVATAEFSGLRFEASHLGIWFSIRVFGPDGERTRDAPESARYYVTDAFKSALAALPDLAMFAGNGISDAWLAGLVHEEEATRNRGALTGECVVWDGSCRVTLLRYASGEVHGTEESDDGCHRRILSQGDRAGVIAQLTAAIEFLREEG